MAKEVEKTSEEVSNARGKMFSPLKKRFPLSFNDVDLEVSTPSVKLVQKVQALADKTDDGSGKAGAVRAMFEYLLNCAYLPGTDEKVFSVGDWDDFYDLPIGPWLANVNVAFRAATGQSKTEEDMEGNS